MAKRLQSWDAYVKEARREPVELPISPDEFVTVRQPSGSTIRKLNRAMRANDNDAAVKALFGDENGQKILDLHDDAPSSVLNEVIEDILDHFGMSADSGNSNSSSN